MMKRFVKTIMLCVVLSCSMTAVPVAAATGNYKPSKVLSARPDETEDPNMNADVDTNTDTDADADANKSPQTGDHRPNPVLPIAVAGVLAGVAAVSGRKLKKENR